MPRPLLSYCGNNPVSWRHSHLKSRVGGHDRTTPLRSPTLHDLEVPAGSTIEKLLDILQETVCHDMIVELNHRFVHARDYPATIVNEGDIVETIHVAFGG